jgi:predicted lipoprotein with Yx(FWY)xxD motif
MKQLRTARALALAVALGTTLLLVAAAQAATTSQSRNRKATGALVGLKKTALGTILVDARGRTLYLFEKDRNGVSMCWTSPPKPIPSMTLLSMAGRIQRPPVDDRDFLARGRVVVASRVRSNPCAYW